jgi:Icc-related predicted phosphoesterase
MKYKVCCVSDLHGQFPLIPDCDLLLLAGDLSIGHTADFFWFRDKFKRWVDYVSQKTTIIGVAGNHDFIFEKPTVKASLPKANWTYLQDSETQFKNFRIWGTPWQPRYFDWAFNLDEPELEKKWDLIPKETDILVCHGPPHGFGDLSWDKKKVGSPSLLRKIEELQPKLVVCGHIHSGYGIYKVGNTTVVNAAYVNENYVPANQPTIVELED